MIERPRLDDVGAGLRGNDKALLGELSSLMI